MFKSFPDWGNKDLKLATLRQIIRQLNLDWEEFKNKYCVTGLGLTVLNPYNIP